MQLSDAHSQILGEGSDPYGAPMIGKIAEEPIVGEICSRRSHLC